MHITVQKFGVCKVLTFFNVFILIYFKMLFISVIAKLNFQHHYSSLQCPSMLKTVFRNHDIFSLFDSFLVPH